MKLLINILITTISVLIAAYLIPGVHVAGFLGALVFSAVLGALNAVLKPIINLLALPINILTLGLFTFVINTIMIVLASSIAGGVTLDSFITALIFGVVLVIVNAVLSTVFGK